MWAIGRFPIAASLGVGRGACGRNRIFVIKTNPTRERESAKSLAPAQKTKIDREN